MKVVFFIDNLLRGGTQRALTYLVPELVNRGHAISIVNLVNEDDPLIIAELEKCGAKIRSVGKSKIGGGYGLFLLSWWLKKQSFDVAVTMLFYSDLIGVCLSRLVGIPTVISSIRSSNRNTTVWMRRLWPFLLNCADFVVFNSATVCHQAITEGICKREKSIVIPNGIQSPENSILGDKRSARELLGLPISGKVLGCVGRLSEEKGYDVLLKAVSLLEQEILIIFVGRGSLEKALKELASQLGLQDRVRFVGIQNDVQQWLAAFDIFVMPSRLEGMSNAVMEAMAAACPVIVSAVDGNVELIPDEKYGWLVEPENVYALKKAILDALNNPKDAKQRGAAAQVRVKENYSLQKMVDAWELVLLGKKPGKGC